MEIHALSTKKIHFQFRNSLIVAQDAFLRVPREILESFFFKMMDHESNEKTFNLNSHGKCFHFQGFWALYLFCYKNHSSHQHSPDFSW